MKPKLLDRVKTYFTSNSVGNALGVITRSNSRVPAFEPEKQVRGITYKAIDKIGLSLSDYEMIVKRKNGDAYANHPLLNLYNNPNPNMTSSDFTHLWAMLYEIYGETFWYKAKGELSNKVKEIYLLDPAKVELKVSGGELIGYILHKANGTQVPFLPDEIYHDKRPNVFNEWRGISIIERASEYINTEIITTRFTMNYMANAASPSGIVSLPDMTEETFKIFTARWREGYEGPENAGKTAFIRGAEAKFQAVGATLKDVDAKAIREMSKEDVLMMLDVPKPLLGATDKEGFGRGNVETLNYIFASEKLEPMMKRLDRIWEKIAEDLGNLGPIEVTHISPVPEDKEFIHKQNTDLVNVALTVNEVRERIGLPPLGNEYDKLVEKQPQISLSAKKVKSEVIRIKKADPAPAGENPALNQDQETYRATLVENNEKYVKKFKTTLSKLLLNQQKDIISKINASTKAFEEWLFNNKEQAELMGAELSPIIIQLMEEQIAETANFISGELLVLPPEQKVLIEQNIKQLAGVFNADTIKALEKTLSEGQVQGESLVKLKKRVEKVYSDAKGYRAERIARTETLRSANRAAELTYKSNGYSEVVWLENPGACEFCQTMAGQIRAIGSNYFEVGDVVTGTKGNQLALNYDNVDTPPLHPNCTCTLVPVGK